MSDKVVIIGGGATGAGIARDAALRGFAVTLIEKNEIGSGTSGHFHGMLHSGARYAANDPDTARECYQENQILRRIAPSAITNTGGLFVALSDQEASYADSILQACSVAGIPTQEISPIEVLNREPLVTPAVKRAFSVPDAYVHGDELLNLNKTAALRADIPATFYTQHEVTGFQKIAGKITSVTVRDTIEDTVQDIACDYVINAAGVWSGQVAQLAGLELDMIFDKGVMVVMKNNYSNAVLNRCRPEGDGDLLVPNGLQSVLGTTSRRITDLADCQTTQEEINLLLAQGTELIPTLHKAEITYAYAGVRPLHQTETISGSANNRAVSRSFQIIDHEPAGVTNMISVIGGKVTTYRRMAEAAVDLLCRKSSNPRHCQTADIVMTPSVSVTTPPRPISGLVDLANFS